MKQIDKKKQGKMMKREKKPMKNDEQERNNEN
jgi:hypothetical protein